MPLEPSVPVESLPPQPIVQSEPASASSPEASEANARRLELVNLVDEADAEGQGGLV